ncbi:MAG: multiheme c-type cytochrome [bacterium]
MKFSKETHRCLGCHQNVTPGIVHDWETSLHSQTTPSQAFLKTELERRISAKSVQDELSKIAVGCYECHSQNQDKHPDSFTHFGIKINVVVSPNDCAVCHPVEAKEYSSSKKAFAFSNLEKNPVYKALVDTVIGLKEVNKGAVAGGSKPSDHTRSETCYGCHGTEVKVIREKGIFKEKFNVTVPDLSNWPNQGVGRINPDGSRGSCSSCHPRHSFSLQTARKPDTCAQCHLEPDVPAWNVYKESKHANIYSSHEKSWNFKNVPWVLGEDFTSPTCSACHSSLVTDSRGNVVVTRTHDFGARLWVRIFGLVYSHAQPRSGETHIIRNKDGLPLPTNFGGEPAESFLIDQKEQTRRIANLSSLCISCHSTSWTEKHFDKLNSTIVETDRMVKSATLLLVNAWEENLADKTNPFDEVIESRWITQWLFYGNSIRYASAMSGAPDYATFKNGWWNMTTNLKEMEEWIKVHRLLKNKVR